MNPSHSSHLGLLATRLLSLGVLSLGRLRAILLDEAWEANLFLIRHAVAVSERSAFTTRTTTRIILIRPDHT